MLAKEYREKMISEKYRFKDDALVVSRNFIGVAREISLGAINFQYMDRGQSFFEADLEIMAPFSRFFIKSSEYTFKQIPKKNACIGTKINNCCLLLSNLSDLKREEFWSFIQINCLRPISEHRNSLSDILQMRVQRRGTPAEFRASSMDSQNLAINVC